MDWSKIRIAVVDDEPTMTKLLKVLLEEELKCQVETFNDATEAYKRLSQVHFTMISLDHRMPKLTGMGIIDLLRTTENPNRNTPVLIFTGYLEEAENVKIDKLDNVLFLEKPVSDEQYLRNVKLAVQMSRIVGSRIQAS